MNYANYNKLLKYNYLLIFCLATIQLFCTKMKHHSFGTGHFQTA